MKIENNTDNNNEIKVDFTDFLEVFGEIENKYKFKEELKQLLEKYKIAEGVVSKVGLVDYLMGQISLLETTFKKK